VTQSPTAATDALDRIERQSGRLGRLIGRLLTLARFDSRPEEIRKEVDVEAVIETIVQDAQFEAENRHVSVHFHKLQACSVLGHRDLLYSALENVVRNAVRYTNGQTCVDISLELPEGERGPEVRIRVRDHGPGVPESELSNILQPFYSVERGRARHMRGTGLGLSIVDRAVQQLGGRISLSNAADGGLIFDIYLPRVGNPSPW
jgi:signal transduction histidine kinase